MTQIMIQYGRRSRSFRKGSEKTIWESSIGNTTGKSWKSGTFIYQPSKRTLIIRVCGRYHTYKQNRKHRNDWEIFMKDVDLEESISFFDHVYFGYCQREWKISHEIVINCKRYVRIQDFCWSEGKTTYQSFRETWCRNNIFWSFDMDGHAKKFVERYWGVANKTILQLYKVVTSCLDDHQFKEEEMIQ